MEELLRDHVIDSFGAMTFLMVEKLDIQNAGYCLVGAAKKER